MRTNSGFKKGRVSPRTSVMLKYSMVLTLYHLLNGVMKNCFKKGKFKYSIKNLYSSLI